MPARLCLLFLLIASACKSRQPEFGVDVFATDTIPVHIHMNLTGSLEMGLRAESFYTTADKSLILITPASLVIQKGAGTATIYSIDSTQRIAVQPIGISPDSADKVGVVGRVVKLTRVEDAKTVSLQVEKP